MFRAPCSILVACRSSSDKTVFTKRLIAARNTLLEPPPEKVVYCYDVWQPGYDDMKGVTFHKGLPSLADLSKYFTSQGGLLVLDDLQDEGCRDKSILDLFTKHSHHRKISVINILQDIFPPGPYAKTISRNAHYIVAFKNPRDVTGMRALVSQAFPDNVRDVLKLFRRETSRPYGYLMLDLHPASDDSQRLFSNILPDEGLTRVFVPEDS